MSTVNYHPLRADAVMRLKKRIATSRRIKTIPVPSKPHEPELQTLLASFNNARGDLMLSTLRRPQLSVVIFLQEEDGDFFAVLFVTHVINSGKEQTADILGTVEPAGHLL